MKYHVEIGHLTKYDAFRVNRDQVMDLEKWFKIHKNVSGKKQPCCARPYGKNGAGSCGLNFLDVLYCF